MRQQQLSEVSTPLHIRYPHEYQQLTKLHAIARRFHALYVALPADKSVCSWLLTARHSPHPALVQLLPCQRPTGTLECAPCTSLRADAEGGDLQGFWREQDGEYYAQRVAEDGSEQWFRIADASVTRAYAARWAKLGTRSILIGTSRRRGARSAR